MKRHFHEPVFPHDRPLYIIWCDEGQGSRYSLAAGDFRAMLAAWDVLFDLFEWDRLTLQDGARVIRSREPVKE